MQPAAAPTPSLTEAQWGELLAAVEDRQVVPILGPELVLVAEADQAAAAGRPAMAEGGAGAHPQDQRPVLLQRWLAAELAQQLQLASGRGAPLVELSDVVCEAIMQRNRPQESLHGMIRSTLNRRVFAPQVELLELAGIRHFDLYLTTCFDLLFSQALRQQGRPFLPDRDRLVYNTRRVVDIPKPLARATVYHLMGSLDTSPFFATWEEDFMEFIFALHGHWKEMPNLAERLQGSNLLLMGLAFDDWIVRYLLRMAKQQRLSLGGMPSYVADAEQYTAPMVFFFTKVDRTTTIISGDPLGFVRELGSRWRARNPEPPTATMPPHAIFISYAREDQGAVERLASALKSAGLPVWLDRDCLEGGDDFERALERAVKECGFFISVVSSHTNRPQDAYVNKERRWAAARYELMKETDVFYIPVAIEPEIREPVGEPAIFRTKHLEQLPDGAVDERFIERLKRLHAGYVATGQRTS